LFRQQPRDNQPSCSGPLAGDKRIRHGLLFAKKSSTGRTRVSHAVRRLVKRRRALVETNPARNNQLQLIEADERWGQGRTPALSVVPSKHRIDRLPMPQKLTTQAAAQRPPCFSPPVSPQTRRAAHNPAPSAGVSGYRPSPETRRLSGELRKDPAIQCDTLPRTSASS